MSSTRNSGKVRFISCSSVISDLTGGGGAGGSVNTGKYKGSGDWVEAEDDSQQDVRIKEARENDVIDSKYGFDRLTQGEKTAYLINMHSGEVLLIC